MSPTWNELDNDLWLLQPDEMSLLPGMTDKERLGFALQLKFRQVNGRYPERLDEIVAPVVEVLAKQVGIDADTLSTYELDSRQSQRHRQMIRRFLGYQLPTGPDLVRLREWLTRDMLPFDPLARHGRDVALEWFNAQRLEPPALSELDRAIRSAVRGFEHHLQEVIYARLSATSKVAIDQLLAGEEPGTGDDGNDDQGSAASALTFAQLKADLGKPSRDKLLIGIERCQAIDTIGLVTDVFKGVPSKFIDQFCQRCATESIRELRRHPVPIRYSMVAMFCWRRRQQVTDGLVDMLVQIIHTIGTRAEKKIDKKQFVAFKKVRGKVRLLYEVAEATVDQPDGVVKEVVYPVVSQKMLKELVAEFGTLSTDVEREVQETMRSAYSHYYRGVLMPALDALTFRSNNAVHRPVIDALAVLQANRDSRRQYYDVDEVPIEGVVPKKWRHIVIDLSKEGTERVNRIDYEVCVLRALRKRLRIKEIWVEGADRYRDPEQDLPADFDEKRDIYYDMLKVPKDAKIFVAQVQSSMRQWLKTFNDGLPGNSKVKLRKQGKNIIHLSPYTALADPPHTAALKREIGQRWSDVELIDIAKEVDLRLNFTSAFRTAASREVLDTAVLQRRLLLCLFGIGTNVGLKRIASQQPGPSHSDNIPK
jgi:hypothetical protein